MQASWKGCELGTFLSVFSSRAPRLPEHLLPAHVSRVAGSPPWLGNEPPTKNTLDCSAVDSGHLTQSCHGAGAVRAPRPPTVGRAPSFTSRMGSESQAWPRAWRPQACPLDCPLQAPLLRPARPLAHGVTAQGSRPPCTLGLGGGHRDSMASPLHGSKPQVYRLHLPLVHRDD